MKISSIEELKTEIYSGSGNDFVMINNVDGRIHSEDEKEITIRLCTGKFPAVDGVIFINRAGVKNAGLKMNYYNRDGSFGAMCGNGARCAAMFSKDKGITGKKSFTIEALNNLYHALIISDTEVRINFPPPEEITLNISIETDFSKGLKPMRVNYVSIGSDHLVVMMNEPENIEAIGTDNPDKLDVNRAGKILRFHSDFQPRGVNVNFVYPLEKDRIRVRTYERGVERETLACGTGAISSAIIYAMNNKDHLPVKILSQSGEWLTVDFKSETAVTGLQIQELSLTGSAVRIS
jgi:diaminopimelate epimerase